MIRPFIIMLTLVALLLSGIFGWKFYTGWQMGQSMAAMAMPPVVVSTTEAAEARWSPTIPVVGTLRALQGVDVTAQIAGQISELNFESGQTVVAGDLLLKQYTADDEARLAGLEADTHLAQLNLKRAEELVQEKLVSETDFDTRRTELSRAQAAENNLRAIIEQKSIRAPFAGRLGIREVDMGQYVEPGDRLVRLESLQQVLVEFPVPQQYIGQLSVGQSLTLVSDAWPEQTFSGMIRALESQIDRNTRMLRVQGIVENPDERLVPGMFVQVEVILPVRDSVLTVPQSVITFSPYGNSVFVLDSGADGALSARKVFVTTGETRGDQVMITSGLDTGATLVTAGQQKLRNGSLVVVDNSVPVSNQSAPVPANN